jgi:hypothetical protein
LGACSPRWGSIFHTVYFGEIGGSISPKYTEIRKGEKLDDLIPMIQQRTYSTGVEHAIVRLGPNSAAPGARVLVSGGRNGISFAKDEISLLFGHTHPRITGPSSADFEALRKLGQHRQYIFEEFITEPLMIRPK